MSRRPLNPYAQPYFPHQSLVSAVPYPNYPVPQTSVDHIEATVGRQNPSRFVAPSRNVGPRLRSPPTSLAENQHSRRPTSTTPVWRKKGQALSFTTATNNHATNEAAASSSSRRGGTRNGGGGRREVGPSSSRSNLGHGVRQGSNFPNVKKGSVIPYPDVGNGSEVTTVMIRNIPCSLSRSQLLVKLKKHCQDENKKAGSLPKSEFDFFYLPLDFKRFWKARLISNLGFAFVNFTTAVGARRFYESHNNSKWDEVVNSPKICEITCAKFQGLKVLKKRFSGKSYPRGLAEEFMPLILDPACDGERESEQVS